MNIKWIAGTGSIFGGLICRFWYGTHLAEYEGSEYNFLLAPGVMHLYHCVRCGQKGKSWLESK